MNDKGNAGFIRDAENAWDARDEDTPDEYNRDQMMDDMADDEWIKDHIETQMTVMKWNDRGGEVWAKNDGLAIQMHGRSGNCLGRLHSRPAATAARAAQAAAAACRRPSHP